MVAGVTSAGTTLLFGGGAHRMAVMYMSARTGAAKRGLDLAVHRSRIGWAPSTVEEGTCAPQSGRDLD